MTDCKQNIAANLLSKIKQYHYAPEIEDVGTVLEIGDGIARVRGLQNVRSQELLEFENGTMGIAFNLEADCIGAVLLGDYVGIHEGSLVTRSNRIISVPAGEEMIGRVVDPLGNPLDGEGPIHCDNFRMLEKIAPGINERANVDTPLLTGIKAIDAMIPIGRGQRELIIGDRQTGKTAIAVDTILNQKGKNVVCVYVAIGQKKSSVARLVKKLEDCGAMDYTIVVSASSDDPAAVQYIAPYAGCAISEEFMENGRDALVVYDDLTRHAWAYRQLSLLLRRPPGREAYPGDLFYLHSRLLERSAKLARKYVLVPVTFERSEAMESDSVDGRVFSGPLALEEAENALSKMEGHDKFKVCPVEKTGGSCTALPIIETLLGDVSAYVPTNVISITDGQIFLESSLFNSGIRPAVNVGISVSRVGGAAQTKAMKKTSGRLRLDMAQYREVATFAQLGSELDNITKQQLERGKILQELLKQPQYQPYRAVDELVSIYAGVHGWMDACGTQGVSEFESEWIHYLHETHADLLRFIDQSGNLTPDMEDALKAAMDEFTKDNKPL